MAKLVIRSPLGCDPEPSVPNLRARKESRRRGVDYLRMCAAIMRPAAEAVPARNNHL
jgi:hypothetical protein